jgi:hypothetical protein
MANELRYFNFPIQLLTGFLEDHKTALMNILDYSIYAHCFKLEFGEALEQMEASAKYYQVRLGSIERSASNGDALMNSIPEKSPMVGINLTIFWDYYNNHKNEFELVCLLAFLALKSILQRKSYTKVDNKFWLARMDGKVSSCEFTQLSEGIAKYANEYQTKKIKSKLREWGLVTYSHYTRGFYISFTMKLEDLVYEAEKKRKSTKEKQYKAQEKEAVERALKRLNEPMQSP